MGAIIGARCARNSTSAAPTRILACAHSGDAATWSKWPWREKDVVDVGARGAEASPSRRSSAPPSGSTPASNKMTPALVRAP